MQFLCLTWEPHGSSCRAESHKDSGPQTKRSTWDGLSCSAAARAIPLTFRLANKTYTRCSMWAFRQVIMNDRAETFCQISILQL